MSSTSTANQLHDAASRKAGRTLFGKPLVLEAGAGTGKTAVLVARVVHWCMGLGWRQYQSADRSYEEIAEAVCEGVVAITFTDAAAVEMQVRVAKAMHGLHRGDTPAWMPSEEFELPEEEIKRRAAALLSAADRLRVQTIHSFCSTLLRQHALTINLHPRFEIDADGSRAEALVLEYLSTRLPQLYGDSPNVDAVHLASNGHGPGKVAEVLLMFLRNAVTSEDLPDDAVDDTAVASVCEELQKCLAPALEVFQSAVAGMESKKGLTGLLKLAEQVPLLHSRLTSVENVVDLSELFAIGGLGAEMNSNKAQEWTRNKFTKTEEGLLSEAQTITLNTAFTGLSSWAKNLSNLEPELLTSAMRLVKQLLGEIKGEMRRAGVQTYSDLLADAHALLKQHPHLAERMAANMDQLMVDEFQDTDALQCEFLHFLVLRPKRTGLPAPDLFLVGDPKQSIYGWRGADLRSYHDFVQTLLADGGERFDLTVNFRSVVPILDEVERCIEPIMVKEEGLQPDFQKLHPAPDQGADSTEVAVEHWVSWQHEGLEGESTSAGRARELEAQALALDLKQRHQRGELQWNDAAILMRSTSAMETYLSCLRDADIPFQVERDKNYYKRREIIDAAALVRSIVDPNDQLALLTLLRSPVVGVPDAAWLPLWAAEFPGLMSQLQGPSQTEILQRLQEVVQSVATDVAAMNIPGMERIAEWHKLLQYAIHSLAELRQDFHILPADKFVHKLRRRFPMEATEAARHLGAHRLANLERFFRRLTASLMDSDGGPQSILRSLRRAVAEGMDESEAAPGDQAMDAVRIMTIHKSKGLTFPHVYLVNTHATPSASRRKMMDFGRAGGRNEFQIFGMSTLGWTGVEVHRKRLEIAERVRLLYVALTRPQFRLVITGKRLPSKKPKSFRQAKSIEALLQFRRGIPELLPEYQARAGKSFELPDIFGARWFFPNPASDPSLVESKTPAPDPELSAQMPLFAATSGRSVPQVLMDLQNLETDRQRAQTRQSKALKITASGTVSHEALREAVHGGEGVDVGLSITDPIFDPAAPDRHARAVGTAVHRALELIDLQQTPESALEKQLESLPQDLRGFIASADLADVAAQAKQVLQQMDNNGMLHELFERREYILGREIPVLLTPTDCNTDEDPLGAIVGTLDLLYRDPADGQLVVADFKSDQIPDAQALRHLAKAYKPQGELYCRAVEKLFPDEEPPRFELWFLRAGEISLAL